MFRRLKLSLKFTIMLSLVFIGAIAVSGGIFFYTTTEAAKNEVSSRGEFILTTMASVRDYTTNEINPLLAPKLNEQDGFIPQIVPTYSAQQVFSIIRQDPKYKDLAYRTAVLNPTNPADLADEFETELIEQFRDNPDQELIYGFREGRWQQEFYKAKPLFVTKPSCLECHSTPEAAPPSLIETYGPVGGFGWELNELIGMEIVALPSEKVFAIARRNLFLAMGIVIGLFAFVVLLINALLKWNIVRPITPMVRLADDLTAERMDADPQAEKDILSLRKFARNHDEVGQLARIFVRMADAVYNRERSFAQQLQQMRQRSTYQQGKDEEFAYFKMLQQKAETIRQQSKQPTSGGTEREEGDVG